MNDYQKARLIKAKEHAASKGGMCISDSYTHSKAKLTWACSNPNHENWETSYYCVVQRGQWCFWCGKESCREKQVNKSGLAELQKLATEKGGSCLSTEYTNSKTRMLFQCSNHEHKPFESNYVRVMRAGVWCPRCGNEKTTSHTRLKDGLERAQAIAQAKGGACLSKHYQNAHSLLEFKCSNPEHATWMAPFKSIAKGHWCAECAKKNLSEDKTRLFFEAHFNKAFPTVRHSWNMNPWTNMPLELDGYCQEFNLAFEHDGEHHTTLSYKKHKKPKDMTYQLFKDHQKKKNCLAHGITLINIPIIHAKHRNDFEAFTRHVVQHCAKMGLVMEFSKQTLSELEVKFRKI